jgi:apolipoprotein N-acyltransferase
VFTPRGIPVLAYIAYAPVFLGARRIPWKFIAPAGLVYGIAAYWLYGFWFQEFLEEKIIFFAGLFGLGAALLLVFPLLKLCWTLFPARGWLAQWVLWLGYEYLKTLGYGGFHYGITAYTQWRLTPVIQIADIAGVWGVNALVVFASAWVSAVIGDGLWGTGARPLGGLKKGVLAHRRSGCIWAACFAAVLVYGFLAPVDYSRAPTVKVALVQSNVDPWLGGTGAMRRNLRVLLGLSSEALEKEPDIDLVVWPETAFVPRIVNHYRRRTDRDRFELVRRLLEYIDSAPVPFLIGNDHGEEAYDHNNEFGLQDYNGALLFVPGKNVIPPEPVVYRKMHLVPITEYFPYDKQFPGIYRILLGSDTHLWEPGKDPVVFSAAGLRFGVPICFEDTFGYIPRLFVRNGAQAIVNMSNDAWAKSPACQNQHLSMALFRSVENRVPSARSTASGETVIIDPNGRITARAEPFTETYLTGRIPVQENPRRTLYTRWGDWAGVLEAAGAAALLLGGLLKRGKKLWQKTS